MEKLTIAAVRGSAAAPDGTKIAVLCEWETGEPFMIELPLPIATHMQIVIQDAAADAALRGGNEVQPAIVEAMALQPSQVPGQEILTVRIDGGMQLQFQVPKDRYVNGIPRPPIPS